MTTILKEWLVIYTNAVIICDNISDNKKLRTFIKVYRLYFPIFTSNYSHTILEVIYSLWHTMNSVMELSNRITISLYLPDKKFFQFFKVM